MKKTYKMRDLDCANCAAKMEDAINKLEGDYGIADIISVSKRFLSWERNRNPERAAELSADFDEFIKSQLV